MSSTVDSATVADCQGGVIVYGRASLSADYVAGTEAIDLSTYLNAVTELHVQILNAGAYIASADIANTSSASTPVKVLHAGNAAAVAANTDLSSVDVTFIAIGDMALS